MDESKLFPPVPDFYCSERTERIDQDDVLPSVIFSCTLPGFADRGSRTPQNQRPNLEFVCREPSCGALLPTEDKIVLDEEAEAPMDPNFFDDEYTLAGRTGFQVWTGTRIMIETLLWTPSVTTKATTSEEDSWERLHYWHDRIREGANVIELGAGVGVVGCSMAFVGARVLITDLPTLVENSVEPNLQRNRRTTIPSDGTHPTWLGSSSVPIGEGRAATTAINWKQPLVGQLSPAQSEQIDLIVASDCVFLVEMLMSLLNTVEVMFKRSSSRQPSLLLSFQRRDSKDGDESKSFTTVNRVISEVKAKNWSIECLAWRTVVVGDDNSEVFVFEIRPNASAP